jgi:ABC-type antimicrobial peptide transport system permease subunit
MSKRYSLNKEDFSKIITGASIALGGALLTYISTIIIEIDFGEFTPVVVAIASILINAGRKFLEGKK